MIESKNFRLSKRLIQNDLTPAYIKRINRS
jgi:hypothetical protein